MLKASGAQYSYGLSRARIRALNYDLTRPEYNNIIGGPGPFDFSGSGVTITAVPIFLKANKVLISDTLDLTAAVTKSAVTVDEIVTAFTAANISGWTASKDSTTGCLKLVCATANAYVQVYGLAARLCKIGQGKGVKALKSDTLKSLSSTPTKKDDTTVTTTDANNKDTSVIIEGYKKGFTGTMIDTAVDYEMLELIESGNLSDDGKKYVDPTSSTKKVVFEVETYNPIYSSGENLEDSIVAWEHKTFRMVKGATNENTKQAGFIESSFALTGTNYKPKKTGAVEEGAIETEKIDFEDWTPEDFDAM